MTAPLRDLLFCSRCGQEWSRVPFHGCSLESFNQLAPFCERCGGTLRSGFLPRVTCQCQREEPK